ncbi:MAG: ATP-binding protein [Ilumatobacteraceae bacterium]|nr:ATP-binding protein [Ilumatobacteraceae bacterium]
MLKNLDSALRQAATSGSRSHVLLVGARGSGKSHVLEVALHRIRREATMAPLLAVARLPEDAHSPRGTNYPESLTSRCSMRQSASAPPSTSEALTQWWAPRRGPAR